MVNVWPLLQGKTTLDVLKAADLVVAGAPSWLTVTVQIQGALPPPADPYL
jgi:hypothetical protein